MMKTRKNIMIIKETLLQPTKSRQSTGDLLFVDKVLTKQRKVSEKNEIIDLHHRPRLWHYCSSVRI